MYADKGGRISSSSSPSSPGSRQNHPNPSPQNAPVPAPPNDETEFRFLCPGLGDDEELAPKLRLRPNPSLTNVSLNSFSLGLAFGLVGAGEEAVVDRLVREGIRDADEDDEGDSSCSSIVCVWWGVMGDNDDGGGNVLRVVQFLMCGNGMEKKS